MRWTCHENRVSLSGMGARFDIGEHVIAAVSEAEAGLPGIVGEVGVSPKGGIIYRGLHPAAEEDAAFCNWYPAARLKQAPTPRETD